MSNDFEAAVQAMKARNAAPKVDIVGELRKWGADVSKFNDDNSL